MSDIAEIDGETEAGAQGGEAAGGGKRKLFIFGGIGLAVVLLLSGAVYFFLFAGGDEGEAQAVTAQTPPSVFYDMPPMTVNLSNVGDGTEQFLKLSVSLELADQATMALIEPRMALVRDAFQVYLRELRRSDLEGSEAIFRLKEELRRRVNLAIQPAEVRAILFEEILVQ